MPPPTIPKEQINIPRVGAEHGARESAHVLYGRLLHDMRNSFAAVKVLSQYGRMEFRKNSLGGAELKKYDSCLERIEKEVNRAVESLESVRYLSSLTGHGTCYDAIAVVKSVLEQCEPLFEERGLNCQYVLEIESSMARGEPMALRQVMANLLENAARAMRGCEDGVCWVHARADDGGLRISITDTGAGMDEATLAALEHEGPGLRSGALGLTVVRWLVEGQKGRVSAISRAGQGTSIDVWLPAVGA